MRVRELVFSGLLAVVLLSQALIDLEFAADIGPWHANAPVVDLAALALLPLAALGWLKTRSALPGLPGYALFLGASALSIAVALYPDRALHHLVRKPLFVYLAYGCGLSWVVARAVPRDRTAALVIAWASSTALLSLVTSTLRIGAGNSLWFTTIQGITPNHKTLAVALSGALPLLLGLATRPETGRLRSAARGGIFLALAAIALSASKSSWITTAFALGLFWPRATPTSAPRRPLSLRPALVVPVLILGFALALYAPVIIGSKTMLDAARSRHSLNVRSWRMFAESPGLGSGTGMSTEVEMITFPHYRVNGVDAHGAVQKVGAETGLLGLAGFGWFTLATGAALRRRWRGSPDGPVFYGLSYGALGTWATLHLNLVLSTETLSPTHWVPLAVAWGLSHHSPSLTADQPRDHDAGDAACAS